MAKKEYPYHYTIYTVPDDTIYQKQCDALESHVPGIKKGIELHDVDGSRIQFYECQGKELRVWNDYDVGAVYVESEIVLEPFFEG